MNINQLVNHPAEEEVKGLNIPNSVLDSSYAKGLEDALRHDDINFDAMADRTAIKDLDEDDEHLNDIKSEPTL